MTEISSATLAMGSRRGEDRLVWICVAAVAMLAVALRLYHLDLKSVSHPEIFVPGIPLPEGISAPPPRLTLRDMLSFHFHSEPHPVGWYLMMMAWAKVAGVSEWAIRLPSVLFSGASVLGIFWVGRLVFGTATGLLAAALLSLHGFHLYWGQIARMYVPGAFWVLIATGLLLTLARSRGARPGVEAGYVATVLAATQTTELVWAAFLTQIFWVAFLLWPARAPVPRIVSVQSVALMLAAPGLLHAVYRARTGAADDPSLTFLGEYLSFGFLMGREDGTAHGFALPALPWALLLVAALVLIVLGLSASTGAGRSGSASGRLPRWIVLPAWGAITLFMLWLASIAQRRTEALFALAVVLPALALALPAILRVLRAIVFGTLPGVMSRLQSVSPDKALIVLLGLLAPVAIALASFVVSVAEPRAFLVFVPFLLILMSAAVTLGLRRPLLRGVAIIGLGVLFALSLPYNAARPVSPRDYKTLYQQMQRDLRDGDLVFIRARDWSDTPMFYYLPQNLRFVTDDYAAVLARSPGARVWLITWPNTRIAEARDARHAALAGQKPVKTYEALRARAQLFIAGGAP